MQQNHKSEKRIDDHEFWLTELNGRNFQSLALFANFGNRADFADLSFEFRHVTGPAKGTLTYRPTFVYRHVT